MDPEMEGNPVPEMEGVLLVHTPKMVSGNPRLRGTPSPQIWSPLLVVPPFGPPFGGVMSSTERVRGGLKGPRLYISVLQVFITC